MQRVALFVVLASIITACSHGGRPQPNVTPAALAAVHADLRLVDNETTWVTRGAGYELVGRSKADLVTFQPALDREAAMFRRVFPIDSLVPVIATVRHQQPEGKPYVTAAPTPAEEKGFVVELVIPDPKTPLVPGFAERNPVLPVVRAWLSAHASALTKQQARSIQAKGETDDPRVPAWAEEMIPMLSADSMVDRFTMDLATHQSEIIPLSEYFTMQRPAPAVPVADRGNQGRGSGGGNGTPPSGSGGRGGMGGGGMGGGMGGMGGGRGGMRGGSRGGGSRGGDRNPGNDDRRQSMPLPQSMVFLAQSTVFGRYLGRESYELIGTMADAQILGQPVDSVLARQKELNLARMDADWKEWLTSRAGTIGHK
jgi:hypothetical protein